MRPSLRLSFAAVLLSTAAVLAACTNGSDTGGPAGAPGSAGASSTAGASGTAGVGAAGAGTAGAVGTAGTSGTAGAGTAGAGTAGAGTAGAGTAGAGTAGTGAAGATGTAGAPAGGLSDGCHQDNGDSSNAWTQHNISVTKVAPAYTANFTSRVYWTRPPANYDKDHGYSLVLWGQGCGQGGTAEGIPPLGNPLMTANAVIVELLASQKQQNHCYSAGPDGDAADSPELAYFDQVVAEVEAEFCIDKSKVFLGGYSSGGWFSSLMSCNRTNIVRGTGWAAAGLQNNHAPCTGPVPALITRGVNDGGTKLPAAMLALESLRTRNGCATTTKPWTPTWSATEGKADTSSCVTYDGCMPGYPLVWCPTPGEHTNTENDTHLTRFALWKLWTSP